MLSAFIIDAFSLREPGSTSLENAILDRQNMDEAQRLLAPLLVDRGAHRSAYRLGERVRVASPRPWQSFDCRYHGVEHDVVDHLSRGVLFRDADQVDFRIVDQFALLIHCD